MTSFNELLNLHREIDEMFLAHQCLLLHFEFESALSQLRTYENALLTHMRDEEEILLPLYAERVPIIKGGGPQLFLDDHEKMRGFIKLFVEQTKRVAAESQPETGLLLLLDREAFYKRLCSHHDHRESDFLYPGLDSVTTATERSDILSRVTYTYNIGPSLTAT